MIFVTYSNNSNATFNKFNKITNKENIIAIDCSKNHLTKLPKMQNYHWPNLQKFNCSFNQLTQLPDMQSCNWPNLQKFDCSHNKLTQLPAIMLLSNLQDFDCSFNQLTHLPENINLPNLQNFNCDFNKLTQLPDIMSMPNLREFYCYNNQLIQLPLYIMTLTRLEYINCSNNPLKLSPHIARFINRINNVQTNQLTVYTNGQNVNYSNIQLCIKDSINALTTRSGIGAYNKIQLINTIRSDPILTCKDQLIEYLEDDTLHSLLLLTWGEVLWVVMRTIELDFNTEQQNEIKLILNQSLYNLQCKCAAVIPFLGINLISFCCSVLKSNSMVLNTDH
jgi:Leucine-rich repeat (LRR) protein